MSDLEFKPVLLDCIMPDNFPLVALYTKGSGGNYILYKTGELPFTDADHQRLQRGGAQCIYVDPEDFEGIKTYLEDNLPVFLENEGISDQVKSAILCQVALEYVVEVFAEPHELSGKLTRCRMVVDNLLKYVKMTGSLLGLLKELSDNKLYILEHSVKVAALTMLVYGKMFEADYEELVDLGVGGILHDFGVAFLSSEILEKPEALSNIEYDMVKKHPLLGYENVKKSGLDSEAALTVIKHHHEHCDGGGYPDRLRGDTIPRSAQIAAICDVYSALTSNRPHRKASSHEDAVRMMKSEAGKTFDAELFERFTVVIEEAGCKM